MAPSPRTRTVCAAPSACAGSTNSAPTSTRFDLHIFAFAAAVSLFTGVLFGIVPAWQATRTGVNSGLKNSATSTTRRRKGLAGRSLVVLQVALSMLLVVGAGLFTRTLNNLDHTGLGFDPRDILLFAVQAPTSRYPAPKDIGLHARIEQRIAAIPGVQSVTLTQQTVLSNSMSDTDFKPTDQPSRSGSDAYAYVNDVGRDFFATYRIPILYGRGFASTDTSTSPAVAVVNQALVRHFYPSSANPDGKTFKGDRDRLYQIVGVAADAKYDQLRDEVSPTFYTLYNQSANDAVMTYAVKTQLPLGDVLPRIRAAVQLRSLRWDRQPLSGKVLRPNRPT